MNLWRPNSFGGRQANSQDSRDIDNTSTAVFGQITYGLSERWDLTLGYRYSDNEKDYFYQLCNDTGTLVGIENCIDAPLERTGRLTVSESNINVTLGWNATEKTGCRRCFPACRRSCCSVGACGHERREI